MVKSRVSDIATPARQSPRKRKVDDIAAPAPCDSTLPDPARHELKRSDLAQSNDSTATRVKRTKRDIVLDDPARTDLVARKEDERDSLASGVALVNGRDDHSGSSELSSLSEEEVQPAKKKIPKKRKTKEEKEAESMPLAPRSQGLTHFVGAHVSIAKGVENAVTNALHIGGNAFALFLQSQRKWENPALKPENAQAFLQACSHHKYDAKQHVVPHGSYLVNLAHKDPDQARKSYSFFLDDIQRCEALGIKYYNFHPGSTNKDPLSEAIARLTENLNRALSETTTVVPLLENMAGTESIIGSRFTDLAEIIAGIKPEYRARIGICIDTCHTFAAGYDLRTPEAFKKTFDELDSIVGLKYLKALHLNDSKGMFGSKKDLHQNIGLGFLGLRAFHSIMNEPRLANLPLILETPCEQPDPKDPKKTIEDKTVWSKEIKLLESLIGMDPESDEYKKLEKDLSDRGKAERAAMTKWQAEKDDKERKKEAKLKQKLEKGQKSIAGMFGAKGRGKRQISSDPSDSESG